MSQTVTTNATVQIIAQVPVPFVERLQREAEAHQLIVQQLCRGVLLRAMGKGIVRARQAPVHTPLVAEPQETTRLVIHVTPDMERFLRELELRTGGVPRAQLMVLIMLEWMQISVIPLLQPDGASDPSLVPDDATQQQVNVRVPPRLHRMILDEAAAYGVPVSVLIRAMIQRARGLPGLERNPALAAAKPLAASGRSGASKVIGFVAPPDMAVFLEQLSWRSGGVSKPGLITLLVLEWLGISPLPLDLHGTKTAAGRKRS
jgi:predicted HicB family RNase H-like nuclease